MCDSCNFKSESETELSLHRHTHFCKLCGLFLQKPSLMGNHMVKVHNYPKIKKLGMKKYCCHLCKKIYSSAGSLYNHKNRIHSTTTVSCKTCGQVFNYKRQLFDHMLRHQSRKIFCSECTAKFYLVSELNKHVNQVHRKVRPYECPKCGKFFCQRTVLNHHMSQHMDYSPVKSVCEIPNAKDNLTVDAQEKLDSLSVTFVLEMHSVINDNVELAVFAADDVLPET